MVSEVSGQRLALGFQGITYHQCTIQSRLPNKKMNDLAKFSYQTLVLTTELASLDRKPVKPARAPPDVLSAVSGIEFLKDLRKSSLTLFSLFARRVSPVALEELLEEGMMFRSILLCRKVRQVVLTFVCVSERAVHCNTCTSGSDSPKITAGCCVRKGQSTI